LRRQRAVPVVNVGKRSIVGVIDRGAAALSSVIVALALPLFAAASVDAQGVTTTGIRGQVRAELARTSTPAFA
jgi:hypothetical protein